MALLLIWIAIFPFAATSLEVVHVEYLPHKDQTAERNFTERLIDETRNFDMKKWVPTGASERAVSKSCNPWLFERHYLANLGSPVENSNQIQNYFSNCEKELLKDNLGSYGAMAKMENSVYKFPYHKHIRYVRLSLDNGERVKGFLALQPGSDPRPMVIAKCGLFCSAGNGASIRTMIMQLFDQSPFHVLVLGNHSGTVNTRDNGRLSFGGFYEGQEMLAVGKWARSNFAVSELHAYGVSLGGHAAFYASLYNDHNQTGPEKLFSSSVAYCPVASLQKSIEELMEDSIKGLIFGPMTWKKLKQVQSAVSDLSDLLPEERPENKDLLKILSTACLRFLRRIDSEAHPFPFKGTSFDHAKDIFASNEFINQSHTVSTPTLAWAALNDPVVTYDDNIRDLIEKHPAARDDNPLTILSGRQGGHCAQSITYGWATNTAVIRAFILGNSPRFLARRRENSRPLSISTPRVFKQEVHLGQIWRAKKDKDYFKLEFQIQTPFNCKRRPPCLRSKTKKVKFSKLPLKIEVPKTDLDAETLTRWMNSYVWLSNQEGPLVETRKRPTHLSWTSY